MAARHNHSMCDTCDYLPMLPDIMFMSCGEKTCPRTTKRAHSMHIFSLFSQRGFLLRCSLCLETMTGCTNWPHDDIGWLIGRDDGRASCWWCARCGVPFLWRGDRRTANIHVGYAHVPPHSQVWTSWMWRVCLLYDVTKRNNKESGHIATKLLRR